MIIVNLKQLYSLNNLTSAYQAWLSELVQSMLGNQLLRYYQDRLIKSIGGSVKTAPPTILSFGTNKVSDMNTLVDSL